MSKAVAGIVESEAFKGLSLVDLGLLEKACVTASRERKEAKAKEMRDHFSELAKEEGLSLSDIFGGSTPTAKKRASVSPKYQNPNNTAEQWSGRGRKPNWVKNHLDNGGQIEDLAI